MKRLLLLISVGLLLSTSTKSQTHIINHDVNWATYNQNMWGPNCSPWNLNMNINLFDVEFDTSAAFGDIVNVLGGDFGAMIDLDSWFHIGSDFIISGFTTGAVDVAYPVTIEMEVPDDDTYCPGEVVTISSEYSVRPGWDLSSHFPTAGVIGLYLNFGFELNLDATICLFACDTIPIIDVNVPYDTITIIELNSQTGVFTYPCYNASNFPPIAICNDTILPITFNNLFGIGLSGSIALPYVETTDWLDIQDACNQNLYAAGDCTWVTLNIDVIQLLSAMAGLIPPPNGPAIQQFLSMLSGTYDLGGGITIDYMLFSAWFDILSTMQQDLAFEPKVWNNLQFPNTVDYFITDPVNGNSIVDSGSDSQISFQACHDLNFIWPCSNVNQMDIGLSHSLSNDFTNHTWDSLSFDFSIAALEFTLNLPSFPVVPPAVFPEFCIDVPVMDSISGVMYRFDACIPEIELPGVFSSTRNTTIHIGPLFAYTWPLGYIPITWYDNTWELAGFNDSIFPTFHMGTSCPGLELVSFSQSGVLCYGGSTGSLSATVQNGALPYTYAWSNGDTTITSATTSGISGLPAGTYYLTVYDANGCSVTDSAQIVNLYPPIQIQLNATQITCVGGNDGSISLSVSGGAPPYSYNWNPTQTNSPLAENLTAGTYSITITDAVGCDTTVSTTLIELYPLPEINIAASPTEGCQPLFVQFTESTPDNGQTYFWDLDEGSHFSSDKNPSLLYEHWGIYDVVIVVTSAEGCVDSVRVADMVSVYQKPVAEFRPNPSAPTLADNSVLFFNQSTNTFQSEWLFGDGGSSLMTYPTHTYNDTGLYIVTLFIITEYGCRDTVSHPLYVKDVVAMYIPNSFTPDGDGINDFFKPIGHGIDENFYSFTVFDRWGKQLFETHDYESAWDGTFNGIKCPFGTYQYVLFYRDDNGIVRKMLGGIDLLR